MPGMPKELKGAKIGDDELKPVEAIIRSMTPLERRKPELINGSRRTRIANGSGTTVGDVNRLVKQFGEMQKMMKKMGAMGMGRGGKGKKGKKGAKRGFPGLPGGVPRLLEHARLAGNDRHAGVAEWVSRPELGNLRRFRFH